MTPVLLKGTVWGYAALCDSFSLPFPPCFLPFPNQLSVFESCFFLLSVNVFNSDQSKNLLFGKELNWYETPYIQQTF